MVAILGAATVLAGIFLLRLVAATLVAWLAVHGAAAVGGPSPDGLAMVWGGGARRGGVGGPVVSAGGVVCWGVEKKVGEIAHSVGNCVGCARHFAGGVR